MASRVLSDSFTINHGDSPRNHWPGCGLPPESSAPGPGHPGPACHGDRRRDAGRSPVNLVSEHAGMVNWISDGKSLINGGFNGKIIYKMQFQVVNGD